MTLTKFELLLKNINPRLRIRHRGNGDVAGVYLGMSPRSGYICRLTKGEIELDSYNNPPPGMHRAIRKRGRMAVITQLKKHRLIKNHSQVSTLLWGLT